MKVEIISYSIACWVLTCIVSLAIILTQHDYQSNFFKFGPHISLKVFDIPIDTSFKYFMVVIYTICSTIIRTLQTEIVSPWIIHNIQNTSPKSDFTKRHAYTIVTIDTLYKWFDWFMYMNILLSQIDMMMIEVTGNIIMSLLTTYIYIYMSKKYDVEMIPLVAVRC